MMVVNAIGWAVAHWAQLLAVVTGVVTVASVVVQLTPTQADDAALAKVMRVLEALSLAKGKPAVASPATADHIDELVDALERGDTAQLRELLDAIDEARLGKHQASPAADVDDPRR